MGEVMQDARLAAMLLEHEVRDFLHTEAELLDERRFEEWLELFTDDVRYWMPIARNVRFNQMAMEYTREGQDTCWFDEGKETLRQRVEQLRTGIHWAEEPRSRTSHLLTNIRVASALPIAARAEEVEVRSRFLLYRNRIHDETDILAGKRTDRLRREAGGWRIARREIRLDQSVLLAKNLTSFL
ncbi:3-phenylpropionate/cinnamic acid dioxygenase subunit beta [Roseomonas indoligenes]|uniref:3-phenylpropionate/cinnamic acid dioxygenase subunit beta n=1 Tax=Roseomonas indoligenes TaxID=2820811 RepID=A0A940N1Y5_9PROT|nr:3-phenylpropionate/cinnamic acid dioxygenase subunit beta [Pararoseomonas indoligenes]MBP0494551.1 3-phenylpropionate/cinnamic acid dioxygenase subunit beta [Pararoseomonas indoligenes]